MQSRTAARPALIFATCVAAALAGAPSAHAAPKPAANAGTTDTAGNGYLQVHIQTTPGQGVGLFTVTTASGKNVLYGNGHPGSSYTTIHSYTTGADYVQAAGTPGISIAQYGSVTPLGSTGFRVTYQLPGAPSTPDKMTVVQDIVVDGDDATTSKVDVTTYVVDAGDTAEQVGVRYLWDYDVNGDDGPVLVTGASTKTAAETILLSAGATVSAVDGSTAASSAPTPSAEATSPDSVRYVSWDGAFHAPFDYTPSPSTTAGGKDSAVLTYFGSSASDAIALAPGQGAVVTASLTAAADKDNDTVTVTVSPKVAIVGEEITITAKESGKPDGDKVSWKAPGGTPDSGKGWTFKTTYKSVGVKTIDIGGLEDDKAPKSVTVNVIKVAFDIDGQTDPNKALVFVKNTVGVIEDGAADKPLRLRTPCHVWVEGEPSTDIKIVLKNPDSKCLFTKALTATAKLTLPADGTKVNFLLYGETQSAAIGDAKVEAHLDDKTDKLLGDQKVTVFFFEPTLTLTPDGQFKIVGNNYEPEAGKPAVRIESSAKAKPATVDIAVGVLADLDIAIAQNMLSAKRTFLEDKPIVKWAPSIVAGTKAKVPETLTRLTEVATASNDATAFNDPLFRPTTARPNAAAVKASTFPDMLATRFDISVKDPDNNEIVGTAIYSIKSISYDDHWRTWCVAYKKDSKTEYPLSEGTWDLKFSNTDAAASQKATTGAVGAAANAPIRGAPFSSDDLKPKIVKGANIEIEQPGVLSVTLTPASIKGGVAGKATIKLTAPAGFGGTTVNLGSNRPTIAKPNKATAVVPAGTTTVDIDIDTTAVGADEHVRISASCHEKEANARLTVTK